MKPENLNTGNGNLGLYSYPIRATVRWEGLDPRLGRTPIDVSILGPGYRSSGRTRCLFFRVNHEDRVIVDDLNVLHFRPGEIYSAIWWRGAWRGGVQSSWVLEGFRRFDEQ